MSKNLKIGEEMETNIRQDNNEEVEIDIMQILMMLLSKIWILIVSGIAVSVINKVIHNQQTEWLNNNT